jgi:hypothetical protein
VAQATTAPPAMISRGCSNSHQSKRRQCHGRMSR